MAYNFVGNREEMDLKLFGRDPGRSHSVMMLGHLQYAKADTGPALGQMVACPLGAYEGHVNACKARCIEGEKNCQEEQGKVGWILD